MDKYAIRLDLYSTKKGESNAYLMPVGAEQEQTQRCHHGEICKVPESLLMQHLDLQGLHQENI